MTDKELLKLAANACNWALEDDDDEGLSWIIWSDNNVPIFDWNPLTNDGDALRLAVKLKLNILISSKTTVKCAKPNNVLAVEEHNYPYAATRRAIVRAAAEIGKKL